MLAQTDGISQDSVNIDILPENPGPNQLVNATISSFSTNVNIAEITWTINGVEKKSGTGVKTFSFITDGLNTTISLGVSARTVEGDVITKTIDIKPTSVDLLWQTESFVPPFYKGKPLYSHQNKITFVALPHITNSSGAEIGVKNLVYTWKLNGSVIENASGFGKNTYSVIGSIISRPLDVEVDVSGANDNGTGVAEIVVAPRAPEIIFYKKNPLYGVEFQNALNASVFLQNSQNNNENSKEITIVGMPFFFGISAGNAPELVYSWSVNGAPIYGDTHQTEQVFRQLDGTSGISQISLEIENQNKILQFATNSFNLQFGQ